MIAIFENKQSSKERTKNVKNTLSEEQVEENIKLNEECIALLMSQGLSPRAKDVILNRVNMVDNGDAPEPAEINLISEEGQRHGLATFLNNIGTQKLSEILGRKVERKGGQLLIYRRTTLAQKRAELAAVA